MVLKKACACYDRILTAGTLTGGRFNAGRFNAGRVGIVGKVGNLITGAAVTPTAAVVRMKMVVNCILSG